jgi:hypothetical protein
MQPVQPIAATRRMSSSVAMPPEAITGVVVAASDVVSFRVGNEFPTVACESVDACTAAIAGELPDTIACVEGRCRQRCASDLDCPGVGTRCELGTALLPLDYDGALRHGAFCTLPTR